MSGRAFVPAPLPPRPELQLDGSLQQLLERATLALGRLDGVSDQLPDSAIFLYSYVRKEAVLSSQIEGTQSSLSDLLLYELDEALGLPIDDVVEVSNYVAALERGSAALRAGSVVTCDLIREIHGVLLARGRGGAMSPGRFRDRQNWIGGSGPDDASYVPPPHRRVPGCMMALEEFLHAEDDGLPALVRAGLAHVQFESIHPFLDGNGRVGRMLVPLILLRSGALRYPLLYLSLYLKQRRNDYYFLLDHVRKVGDWETWLKFFLTGVQTTSEEALVAYRRLSEMSQADRKILQGVGRLAGSSLRVHEALVKRPILSLSAACRGTGLSFPAASAAMRMLVERNIAREISGRRRGRVFAYERYLSLLSEGADPT